MSDRYRYCEYCDQELAEWDTGYDGADECPYCRHSLTYESRDEYIDEMVRWLGKRYNWPSSDVRQFLADHGNPGKGQAAGIIKREGLRDGRYSDTGSDRDG